MWEIMHYNLVKHTFVLQYIQRTHRGVNILILHTVWQLWVPEPSILVVDASMINFLFQRHTLIIQFCHSRIEFYSWVLHQDIMKSSAFTVGKWHPLMFAYGSHNPKKSPGPECYRLMAADWCHCQRHTCHMPSSERPCLANEWQQRCRWPAQ